MSNKVQLIRQEIERRIKNLEFSLENNCVEKYSKLDILGNITTLESLLQFIDSLPEEPASEDLDEELHSWMRENCDDNGFFNPLELARHFAEWQKQKDFEELLKSDMSKFKECYEKGKADAMKEIMKDAVKGRPFYNTTISN